MRFLVDSKICTIEGHADDYLFQKLLEHELNAVTVDYKGARFVLSDDTTGEIILTANDVLVPRVDIEGT